MFLRKNEEGMMSAKKILIRKKDGICTLILNRPEVMNAWSAELLEQLVKAVNQAAKDDSVKVLILEGAGKNFCSGADMSLLGAGGTTPQRYLKMRELSRFIRTMREMPKPIIAKVRGYAVGAGANLALAADFVVAAESARFCEIFVNIGVMPDAGGFYFLPRLVGLARARELALLGEIVEAKRAVEIGLIYRAIPDKELDREVDALALKLAQKSSMALAVIKEGLEKSLDMTLDGVMEWEASHQSIMLQTEEHKEAVRRFLEARGKKK
jgi:2-(1,2-epoxy-1,2-dihydrophenyl)acetyl-CoA isomerase